MKKLFKKDILQAITGFYTKSSSFNGIPITKLLEEFDCEWDRLKIKMIELINENKITLRFGVNNPYIKRFPDPSLEEQIKYLQSVMLMEGTLRTFEGGEICAYPTENVIRSTLDISAFNDKPFTQMLLLGAPQIYPTIFFEMKVLERYYNDPRYIVGSADYKGKISTTYKYSNDPNMLERDRIVIEFGLAYDDKQNIVITVPLHYLYRLHPQQQEYWKTFMINDECKMSESYRKNIILGEFAEDVSIYKAIIKEQKIINDMCNLMSKPNLFRKTFEDGRPKDFAIILSPTRVNYLKFIHTLDKMLSDNLNKKYFEKDITLEEEFLRKDGRIEVRQRNTIHLLKEWLRKSFILKDDRIFDEIIKPLSEVREIRHEPAHKITDDEFDNKYCEMQKEIISKIYVALRDIRLLFSLHPEAKDYKIPNWLYEGRIENY